MTQPSSPRTSSSTPIAFIVGALIVLAVVAVAVLLLAQPGGEGAAPSVPGSPSAAPTATVTPTPTLNEALLSKRLTILVIGKDRNAARAAADEPINTDTLILASVSADQSKVTLVSVPRDTTDVPLPDGGTWERKINAIYRDEGIDTLVGAAEQLFDVPIDGYVAVDMDDMATLVDAAGGVTVDVKEPLHDPQIGLDLAAGEQQLDGAEALKYVRTRVDTDYGRAARQQEVLLALVDKLVAAEGDVDLRGLLDGLDSLETDLSLDDLPTLVEIARRASDAERTTQVLEPARFVTFEGDAGDGRGYVIKLDLAEVRAFVQEQLAD